MKKSIIGPTFIGPLLALVVACITVTNSYPLYNSFYQVVTYASLIIGALAVAGVLLVVEGYVYKWIKFRKFIKWFFFPLVFLCSGLILQKWFYLPNQVDPLKGALIEGVSILLFVIYAWIIVIVPLTKRFTRT